MLRRASRSLQSLSLRSLPSRCSGLRASPQPLLARGLSSSPASSSTAASSAAAADELPAGALQTEPAVRYATRDDAFLMFEGPVYSRMVNMIMKDGKKETARKHLWKALMRIRETGDNPQDVLYGALENVRPMIMMKSFRTGQVPFPINPRRSQGQAMKWIIQAARGKKGAPKNGKFDQRLARELLAAYQNKGSAIAKKEQVHKEGVANQAAAHFRWRVSSSAPPGSIKMDNRKSPLMGRKDVKRLQTSMPRAKPTAADDATV